MSSTGPDDPSPDDPGPGAGPGEEAAVVGARRDGRRRSRPPRRLSNGRIALLVAAVVAALALIGFAVVGSNDDPPSADRSTTAAPSTEPTTPPTEARIATAKNPSILVHSSPPDGWDDMEPVEVWDAPVPPSSQASTEAARPPLPRDIYPIKGRYTDPSGWSFSNPSGWGRPVRDAGHRAAATG